MSAAKTLSLFSLSLLVTAVEAQPPRPIGLPAPRPPVVGMPIRPPVGPRPPIVGMPIRPPVRPPVGPRPPIVGMPIRPPVHPIARNLELDCRADRHGNHSGFRRVKLDLERTGHNTFHVDGFVRYFDGAEARIHTHAVGELNRGTVHLGLGRVGNIDLHTLGHGHHGHSGLLGEITLFGRRDINGMICELDRD